MQRAVHLGRLWLARHWPDLPILLAAAVLTVAGALLMANLVLTATTGRTIKLVAALHGVPPDLPLTLNQQTVLDGTFESEFAQYLGPLEPFYPAAVRLNGQLHYSLFGDSAITRVVVGKHRELLQRAYLLEYCARDVAAFLPDAAGWAAQIRRMQDLTQRRGKLFLYVLTPSKVAQYPEFIPPQWPCPSRPADRLGLVPAWLRLLRGAGVNIADTVGALSAAHSQYPFALYPRGGVHWNDVGMATGAQAVLAALHTMSHDPRFAPLRISWRMSRDPVGTDIDLANLMNLMHTPDRFWVPQTTVTPAPASSCGKQRITIVGGSFMIGIATLLAKICGVTVVEYEYWSADRLTFKPGIMTKQPADPTQRAHDMNTSNIIIYEENEQLLGHVLHGPQLAQWLTANWAANTAPN